MREQDEGRDMDLIGTAEFMTPVWKSKARENVEKWGLQSTGVILLAIAEEVGEMADEMVDDEHIVGNDEEKYALREALKEIRDTGMYIQELHEDIYEDDDGEPLDGAITPDILYYGETGPMTDELADTAALLIQMQAALDRINLE